MAIVSIKVLGNTELTSHDVQTVKEAKESKDLAGYSASVNGVPQNDDFILSSGELVTLAPSVKGGNK